MVTRNKYPVSYLGIDPGIKGGLSVHIPKLETWEYVPMPSTMKDTWDYIHGLTKGYAPICYIEHVHTSPQMGVRSAGTFMQNKGQLLMALTAASIPFEEIRPVKWQTAMRCRTKGDKEITRKRAQELFPNLDLWERTKTFQLHVVDALLICEYLRRVKTGEL